MTGGNTLVGKEEGALRSAGVPGTNMVPCGTGVFTFFVVEVAFDGWVASFFFVEVAFHLC